MVDRIDLPSCRLHQLGRLLAALVGVYELRYLITRSGILAVDVGSSHIPRLYMLAPVALILLWLLREAGRGLPAHIGRPQHTGSLIKRWCLCCSVLVTLVGAATLTARLAGGDHRVAWLSALGADPLACACSVVGFGLVLAICLVGRQWILKAVARWCQSGPVRSQTAASLPAAAAARVPMPLPLLAGWSGRGPPR